MIATCLYSIHILFNFKIYNFSFKWHTLINYAGDGCCRIRVCWIFFATYNWKVSSALLALLLMRQTSHPYKAVGTARDQKMMLHVAIVLAFATLSATPATSSKRTPGVGGGGTQVQKGAAPSLRISRKKGSFFKTSACPRFCKRRVLFCTQVRSMGVKIPLQSTKYTQLWLPKWLGAYEFAAATCCR